MSGDRPRISVGEQIRAVERELGYRRRVYPRRVEQGHMTQALADAQTRAMEDVLHTLKQVAKRERLI